MSKDRQISEIIKQLEFGIEKSPSLINVNLFDNCRKALIRQQLIIEQVTIEAQSWKGESRSQKSTVHEIMQIVSGATGEKADWNGARPVKEKIAALEDENEKLREIAKCFLLRWQGQTMYDLKSALSGEELRIVGNARDLTK